MIMQGENTRRVSGNGFNGLIKETITGYAVDDKDSIEYMVESPLRCGFLLVSVSFMKISKSNLIHSSVYQLRFLHASV